MNMEKVAIVGGVLIVGGLLTFVAIKAINTQQVQTVQTYTQPQTQAPLPAGSEGNIIYGILAGLGVGIGGVVAGVNASNRNQPKTPTAQQQQPANPATGTGNPAQTNGAPPGPYANFDWSRLSGG